MIPRWHVIPNYQSEKLRTDVSSKCAWCPKAQQCLAKHSHSHHHPVAEVWNYVNFIGTCPSHCECRTYCWRLYVFTISISKEWLFVTWNQTHFCLGKKAENPVRRRKIQFALWPWLCSAKLLQIGWPGYWADKILRQPCTLLCKIKQHLWSVKDLLGLRVPGVYWMPCQCGASYVGQTVRLVSLCITEHKRYLRLRRLKNRPLPSIAGLLGMRHILRIHQFFFALIITSAGNHCNISPLGCWSR